MAEPELNEANAGLKVDFENKDNSDSKPQMQSKNESVKNFDSQFLALSAPTKEMKVFLPKVQDIESRTKNILLSNSGILKVDLHSLTAQGSRHYSPNSQDKYLMITYNPIFCLLTEPAIRQLVKDEVKKAKEEEMKQVFDDLKKMDEQREQERAKKDEMALIFEDIDDFNNSVSAGCGKSPGDNASGVGNMKNEDQNLNSTSNNKSTNLAVPPVAAEVSEKCPVVEIGSRSKGDPANREITVQLPTVDGIETGIKSLLIALDGVVEVKIRSTTVSPLYNKHKYLTVTYNPLVVEDPASIRAVADEEVKNKWLKIQHEEVDRRLAQTWGVGFSNSGKSHGDAANILDKAESDAVKISDTKDKNNNVDDNINDNYAYMFGDNNCTFLEKQHKQSKDSLSAEIAEANRKIEEGVQKDNREKDMDQAFEDN